MLLIGTSVGSRLSVLGYRRASRTEHREPIFGFTLVEIMVTVAVLSLGAVMLYQAFFVSFDAAQYAKNRLLGQLWMDGIVEQEKIIGESSPMILPVSDHGVFVLDNRPFSWQKIIAPLDENLYSLLLTVSWKEGARTRTLSRATYLIS